MFKYHIRGENITITESIRDYAEKKISKLEKYFADVSTVTAHVNAKVYPNKKAKAEVTIPLPGVVLRAEETTDDLYGSIDLVIDKLERQVRKYKTRINRHTRKYVEEPVITAPTTEEPEIDIIRVKRIDVKPMTPEEAALQMELSGHDFYVFRDAESGKTHLVYRRSDGKVGLLETDI